MNEWAGREAHGGMFRTMLKTGGTVAISVGALLTAGGMNLAVLNGGPSGPGNLVIRAAAAPTTSAAAPKHTGASTDPGSTSTTAAARELAARVHAAGSTTTEGSTTSTNPGTAPPDKQPTTTTTRAPGTTTTTTKAPQPDGARVFTVHDAGRVRVHWVNKRTISAFAIANSGWTLPHDSKQGPDITMRFSSKTQLVVWHAWVEAGQIKAWIKTYNLP
jgi:hypothetical protein